MRILLVCSFLIAVRFGLHRNQLKVKALEKAVLELSNLHLNEESKRWTSIP